MPLPKLRVGQFIVTIRRVLQGGFDVEGAVPSECAPAARGYNRGSPIANGIGVDGKRNDCSVRQGESEG